MSIILLYKYKRYHTTIIYTNILLYLLFLYIINVKS